MTEATAAEHDQERDYFAHIRHELKTPVNAVIGYSELLMEDAEDRGQDGFIPDLHRIHTAGKTLLTLINELLVPEHAGAALRVWEPEAPETHAAPADDLPDEVPLAPAGHGNLLVVDDNDNNRDMLSRRLQRQGHTVAVAEHGRQALEMLTAASFDLVLLDIMMPEMDGYQALRQIKADPALRHIPVIMLSALGELESVVRCIEMGAEDYLPKPFNPVLLQARIGACLEKKRLRDQEIEYLRNVAEVTNAAGAVEAGVFAPEALEAVATRPDALGQLARVFQKMGREVQAREQQLQRQVQQLRIEIDQSRKERQVAEITGTDYFQELQRKAGELRNRNR
jgi:DNA-binding response OmpR family regulator